jgi:hypothetical protein
MEITFSLQNLLYLQFLSRKTEGIGPAKSWQPIPVGATS